MQPIRTKCVKSFHRESYCSRAHGERHLLSRLVQFFNSPFQSDSPINFQF